MSKYKLLKNDFITRDGVKLYRIQALKDFNYVKAGDIGGYVESESNLSQHGNCWVYNYAIVRDNAYICDNARIYDDTRITDKARISGKSCISGDMYIGGYARITDWEEKNKKRNIK